MITADSWNNEQRFLDLHMGWAWASEIMWAMSSGCDRVDFIFSLSYFVSRYFWCCDLLPNFELIIQVEHYFLDDYVYVHESNPCWLCTATETWCSSTSTVTFYLEQGDRGGSSGGGGGGRAVQWRRRGVGGALVGWRRKVQWLNWSFSVSLVEKLQEGSLSISLS